jgi:hypothetical protein
MSTAMKSSNALITQRVQSASTEEPLWKLFLGIFEIFNFQMRDKQIFYRKHVGISSRFEGTEEKVRRHPDHR